MNWHNFCSALDFHLHIYSERLNYKCEDEKITYTINNQDYTYTEIDFNTLKNHAEQFSYQPYSIVTDYYQESIVDSPDLDSRRRLPLRFEDNLISNPLIDTENQVTYSFKCISEDLIYHILSSYENERPNIRNSRIAYSMFEHRCESLEDKSIFSILRIILRLPLSICIESPTPIPHEKLLTFTKSHLFNLAYNLDIVFKPITEPDILFPKRVLHNTRRVKNIEELMPPKLSYKNELTDQYYMALSSSDPFVKFIGFYHIFEYFYESIYNDNILDSIKHTLQSPGFSSKRKKDIIKLIEIIKKKTRQNKEEFQGSELEALELTIEKFIDFTEFVQDLSSYDANIIDYYSSHEISFSKGDSVNLHDITNEKLPKKLAARIYKTRNALVHNKSNDNRLSERGIYKPFKDNDELSKEIPLMRFLSETIIINSALSL